MSTTMSTTYAVAVQGFSKLSTLSICPTFDWAFGILVLLGAISFLQNLPSFTPSILAFVYYIVSQRWGYEVLSIPSHHFAYFSLGLQTAVVTYRFKSRVSMELLLLGTLAYLALISEVVLVTDEDLGKLTVVGVTWVSLSCAILGRWWKLLYNVMSVSQVTLLLAVILLSTIFYLDQLCILMIGFILIKGSIRWMIRSRMRLSLCTVILLGLGILLYNIPSSVVSEHLEKINNMAQQGFTLFTEHACQFLPPLPPTPKPLETITTCMQPKWYQFVWNLFYKATPPELIEPANEIIPTCYQRVIEALNPSLFDSVRPSSYIGVIVRAWGIGFPSFAKHYMGTSVRHVWSVYEQTVGSNQTTLYQAGCNVYQRILQLVLGSSMKLFTSASTTAAAFANCTRLTAAFFFTSAGNLTSFCAARIIEFFMLTFHATHSLSIRLLSALMWSVLSVLTAITNVWLWCLFTLFVFGAHVLHSLYIRWNRELPNSNTLWFGMRKIMWQNDIWFVDRVIPPVEYALIRGYTWVINKAVPWIARTWFFTKLIPWIAYTAAPYFRDGCVSGYGWAFDFALSRGCSRTYSCIVILVGLLSYMSMVMLVFAWNRSYSCALFLFGSLLTFTFLSAAVESYRKCRTLEKFRKQAKHYQERSKVLEKQSTSDRGKLQTYEEQATTQDDQLTSRDAKINEQSVTIAAKDSIIAGLEAELEGSVSKAQYDKDISGFQNLHFKEHAQIGSLKQKLREKPDVVALYDKNCQIFLLTTQVNELKRGKAEAEKKAGGKVSEEPSASSPRASQSQCKSSKEPAASSPPPSQSQCKPSVDPVTPSQWQGKDKGTQTTAENLPDANTQATKCGNNTKAEQVVAPAPVINHPAEKELKVVRGELADVKEALKSKTFLLNKSEELAENLKKEKAQLTVNNTALAKTNATLKQKSQPSQEEVVLEQEKVSLPVDKSTPSQEKANPLQAQYNQVCQDSFNLSQKLKQYEVNWPQLEGAYSQLKAEQVQSDSEKLQLKAEKDQFSREKDSLMQQGSMLQTKFNEMQPKYDLLVPLYNELLPKYELLQKAYEQSKSQTLQSSQDNSDLQAKCGSLSAEKSEISLCLNGIVDKCNELGHSSLGLRASINTKWDPAESESGDGDRQIRVRVNEVVSGVDLSSGRVDPSGNVWVLVNSDYYGPSQTQRGIVPLVFLNLIDDRPSSADGGDQPGGGDPDEESSDEDDNVDGDDEDEEGEDEEDEDEEDEDEEDGDEEDEDEEDEEEKMEVVEEVSTGFSSGVEPAANASVFQFGGSSLPTSTPNSGSLFQFGGSSLPAPTPNSGSLFQFGGSSVPGTSSSSTVQFGVGLPTFALKIPIPQPNVEEKNQTKTLSSQPTGPKSKEGRGKPDETTFHWSYEDTANQFFSKTEFETFKGFVNALPKEAFREELLETIDENNGEIARELKDVCDYLKEQGKSNSMDFTILNAARSRFEKKP